MTEAQARRFYFPAWNRAFAARWVRDRGTVLPRPEAPANALGDQVQAAADARAGRYRRNATADDLRHACHVIALGRDLSSHDLTNAQVDRVVALFDLLADPDNLAARMRWDSPAEDARRRMEWSVRHSGFPEAYIRHVSRGKFSTGDWESLADWQLRQLVMTLKNRARTRIIPQGIACGDERASGTEHGAPCAAGAPAGDDGLPGPEGEGDPF